MTYFTFVIFRSLSLVSSGKTHCKKYGTSYVAHESLRLLLLIPYGSIVFNHVMRLLPSFRYVQSLGGV